MSTFHELEQRGAQVAELTEQNRQLKKALDGRRKRVRQLWRKLDQSEAALKIEQERRASAENLLAKDDGTAILDLLQVELQHCSSSAAVFTADFTAGVRHALQLALSVVNRNAPSPAGSAELPRLATPDQIRDALRGGPLVDGVRYPVLSMDEALGFLADRVSSAEAGPVKAAGLRIVPRELLDDDAPDIGAVLRHAAERPSRHGWTTHGYACCADATIGGRPTSRARCMGNPACPKCKTEADQIHAGFPLDGGGQQ